jgi:hypothetical protein
MAIFAGARLFSLFNGPYLRKLVNLLDFTSGDCRIIAGPILTQCYEKIRAREVNQLNRERYLNYSFKKQPRSRIPA